MTVWQSTRVQLDFVIITGDDGGATHLTMAMFAVLSSAMDHVLHFFSRVPPGGHTFPAVI